MLSPTILNLLERSGAGDMRHSGRSLVHHLIGTYELLRSWGAPEHVQLAGLFHSIYGTAVFKHASLPFDERSAVRAEIGPQAERLAYLFCVADRPRELVREGNFLTDRNTRGHWILDWETMAELREIEAANLIEQGGNIGSMLGQLLILGISPAAQKAIRTWNYRDLKRRLDGMALSRYLRSASRKP
jgi:hypothetical protein